MTEHTANLALAQAKAQSAYDKIGKNFFKPVPRLQREAKQANKKPVAMGKRFM